MILLYVFCSLINFVNWLQNHLIPCPFKALTGIDCPGCGFQRSFVALLQGDLSKSWALYPSTIPLVVLFVSAGVFSGFPFKNKPIIMTVMSVLVGNFVLISYLYKMLIR